MSGYYFPVIGDYRISSGFGGRDSPGGIGSTNHQGIDIAAPAGRGVIAPTDIRITTAGQRGGYGNYIAGTDSVGNTYEFGHLSRIDVKPGQMISAGSMIGAVGSTGNSTGNHLHFGIKNSSGQFVNPIGVLKNAYNKGADIVDKTSAVLGQASDLLTGDVAAMLKKGLSMIPGYGTIAAGAMDALGLGAGCDWLCQLKKWILESGFFQRLALAFLALIILGSALFMLKGQYISQA